MFLDNKENDNLHINLNSEINVINNSIENNKLCLNVAKINHILFQNLTITINMPPVTLKGTLLETSEFC